jgi:hypothetical protein
MSIPIPKKRPLLVAASAVAIVASLAVAPQAYAAGETVNVYLTTTSDSGGRTVTRGLQQQTPIAFASRSSSAEPNPRNPSNQVVVHPPCSPQFLQGHQPAAPQDVLVLAQPTVAQGQQFVVHQPAAPQAVAHHVQRTTPRTPARDEQGWWLCKEKGCDQRRFATHQALGGHMSSHMRQKNYGGDPACANPAKLHPCKHCPREFTSPLQLGGHMSKHREKAGSKKHGARPKVLAHEIAPALALSLPMPPAAMEVAPAQPAVAPGVPGVLRLFGVNIVPAGSPASAAEEVPAALTETDQNSGIEQ